MAASAPAALPETGPRPASGAMIWTALAVVYVVWGSTYLAIRVVVDAHIPPMLGMASRFLTAAVLLAAALSLKSGWRRLRITRREAIGAATVGILLLAFRQRCGRDRGADRPVRPGRVAGRRDPLVADAACGSAVASDHAR